MSITTGNDFDRTSIGNQLLGLYYYYVPTDVVGGLDSSYLGFAPTIQTISYNPFLDTNDLNLLKVNFDTTRFGTPNEGIPKCYRILNTPIIEKTLKVIEHEFNKTEPILDCFPFKYYVLFDGFNQPMIIKPQLIEGNTITIKVKTFLNQNSKYCLYVENYKCDEWGNIEGIINNSPMLAPVTSSAYSQFLATSSSKFFEQNNISMMENELTYNQNMESANLTYKQNLIGSGVSLGLGVLGGLATKNPFTLTNAIGTSITNGIFASQNYDLNTSQLGENKQMTDYAIQRMELATVADYVKTPRAVKSLGNDLFFNMGINNKCVYLYEYGMSPQQTFKVKTFLDKFGYIVNSYLSKASIDLYSRKYWNFIKFTKCEIDGDIIPREHLEEMKQLFESGITFWHVRNNVKLKDYSKNNVEV